MKETEEEFWYTIDYWLTNKVDKEILSELCLAVGTQLQQELKGTKKGNKFALEYINLYSH